jgi:hypothetical protein
MVFEEPADSCTKWSVGTERFTRVLWTLNGKSSRQSRSEGGCYGLGPSVQPSWMLQARGKGASWTPSLHQILC